MTQTRIEESNALNKINYIKINAGTITKNEGEEIDNKTLGMFLGDGAIALAFSQSDGSIYFLNLDKLCYISEHGDLVFGNGCVLSNIDHEKSKIPDDFYIEQPKQFGQENNSLKK